MKSINMGFTKWYNKLNNRKGVFWAERYHSTILSSTSSILECMMYVDLNPVRAKIAKYENEYEYSSFYARTHGKDELLSGFRRFFGFNLGKEALQNKYQALLQKRGGIADRFDAQKNNGLDAYKSKEDYTKKKGYFEKGLLIGGKKDVIHTCKLFENTKSNFYYKDKPLYYEENAEMYYLHKYKS